MFRRKVLDEDYLRYRISSVAYLAQHLAAAGIQIIQPPGEHAIYFDAVAFCPHIPPMQFPGQALVCALYREAGHYQHSSAARGSPRLEDRRGTADVAPLHGEAGRTGIAK